MDKRNIAAAVVIFMLLAIAYSINKICFSVSIIYLFAFMAMNLKRLR